MSAPTGQEAKTSPPPAAIPPFGLRTITGCLGMLLAVHVAGFNEHVTELGLSDLRGAMHLGHDEGTWFISVYEACNIAAMAFTPWFYMTFSIYRFALFMTAALALLSLPLPFMTDMVSIGILRAMQGLSAGCLPPILMTVMLKYLPPPLKVFGIGGYAMSATFGPNLGIPFEALLFERLGWHWLYWEVLPLGALALVMIAWGLPQDPVQLSRFRGFNWRGFLIGAPSILCIVTVLYQGDRLDWFRSPLITHLTFWGGALFLGFLIHEWHHHSPFFRLQYWKSRNITMSLLALVAVLIVCALMNEVTTTFLEEIKGYRPVQAAPVALTVALPQLVVLPLVAALCNMRRVDCRWVLGIGMTLLGLSAWLGLGLTSEWVRDNFYLIQALQIFGQPMVVIPVLMLATLALGPSDGPFISGMVNMLKGMANALAFALFSTLLRRREQYHSTMLLDHPGMAHDPYGADMAGRLHEMLSGQALVLALVDILLVVVVICAAFVVLTAILPGRVYPPGKAPADRGSPLPAPPSPQAVPSSLAAQ
ncbi:MFS transporter [Asaia siamensis]|uniref:MFS transporter n=1 Tax=Asaia siamensis TaxID=110479 RepID=A0ABQ1MJ26_9PROT|nr:MFS transporter [Asaia siamensis]GGC41241.1 MFS transporter [Asaia siamensis]